MERAHSIDAKASWLLVGGSLWKAISQMLGVLQRLQRGDATERMWQSPGPLKMVQKPHLGSECLYWFQMKPT